MWLKKTIIISVVILALGFLFLLSGGGIFILQLDMLLAHDKNVTQKDKYWGEYENEQIYELEMDVFLEQVDNWSKRQVLTPPGQIEQCAGLYSAPDSVAEYKEYPGKWPEVTGIVNGGTQIQCKMLRKHGTLLWGSSITVFAEILDGPYKGEIVDIDDLSLMVGKEYRGCILNKPDPRILRKIMVNEETKK